MICRQIDMAGRKVPKNGCQIAAKRRRHPDLDRRAATAPDPADQELGELWPVIGRSHKHRVALHPTRMSRICFLFRHILINLKSTSFGTTFDWIFG